MTAETITPNDDVTALSDRALLERIVRQLYHLDEQIHGHGQLLDEIRPLVPLIPRVLALLDPGRSMRKLWRPDAIPKSKAAPLHVGKAPADSGPLDP